MKINIYTGFGKSGEVAIGSFYSVDPKDGNIDKKELPYTSLQVSRRRITR